MINKVFGKRIKQWAVHFWVKKYSFDECLYKWLLLIISENCTFFLAFIILELWLITENDFMKYLVNDIIFYSF